jgi:hypothetical protein
MRTILRRNEIETHVLLVDFRHWRSFIRACGSPPGFTVAFARVAMECPITSVENPTRALRL